jgi:hypothetical protein
MGAREGEGERGGELADSGLFVEQLAIGCNARVLVLGLGQLEKGHSGDVAHFWRDGNLVELKRCGRIDR